MSHRQGRAGGHRPALHLPDVAHRPYWARLVPPGELPRRAVLIRLVLALGLAAALWIGVSNAQDPAITISYSNVQVTVVSPAGYYPVQGPPPVTVVLRGLSSNVKDAPRPLAFAYPKALFPMTAQSVPIVVKNLPPGAENFTTIEIKCNYLGTTRPPGFIRCEAEMMHSGRTTQVWDARVLDEATGKTIALFRCTQLLLYGQQEGRARS